MPVLARFYRPGGMGFKLFFCAGVGSSPIKKLPGGLAPPGGGVWSGLELTDTLSSNPLMSSTKAIGRTSISFLLTIMLLLAQ